jgi:glycine cleavage system regulatory protein
MNRPGIIHEISNFIIQQSVHIEDLQTNTYVATLSGSSLFVLNMRVGIPIDRSIAEFREQFLLLLDDLNLDGILEPERR